MKFSIGSVVMLAVSGLYPSAAFGAAVPEVNALALAQNAPTVRAANVLPRAGEWEYIVYNGAQSGQQCGGVETGTGYGTGDKGCTTVKTSTCAEINVSANIGFASCTFKWSRNSCGDSSGSTTVNKGDTVTTSLDSVQFVTVECD